MKKHVKQIILNRLMMPKKNTEKESQFKTSKEE
jgi:hypothetical protein